MESKNREFKVGDKVTCRRSLARGMVVYISKEKDIVDVNFDGNGHTVTYTGRGFFMRSDRERSLYHGHLDLNMIQNFIEEMEVIPERKVKKTFYYAVLRNNKLHRLTSLIDVLSECIKDAKSNAHDVINRNPTMNYELVTIQNIELEVEE